MALWAWSSSYLIPSFAIFSLVAHVIKKAPDFSVLSFLSSHFCRGSYRHPNYRVLEVASQYGSTQKPTRCDGMPAFFPSGPQIDRKECTLSVVRQSLCLKSSIKTTFSLMLCCSFPVFFVLFVVWIPFSSEHVHGISLSLCVCWRPKMRRE